MKSLDEQLKQIRNSSPSVSAISTESNLLFLEKYGKNGNTGKKIFDGNFIPGVIYLGDYKTRSRPSKQHPWINRKPLFLCVKIDRYLGSEIIVSLDLNIIPPDYRGQIILKVWNQFSPIISQNESGSINQPIPNLYNSLRTILGGTGWQNSLTGFKKEYLGNIKVIDYSDWVRIPYLSDSMIEGQTISSIYNDYRSKLNA